VVGSFRYQHLLDVVNLVEQQNLDGLNLDVDLTCQVVAHQLHQLVEQVDVELRHQLRMDYFLDAVDVELRFQMRMDYFLDVALESLALVLLQHQELRHRFQQQLVAQYCSRQSRALAQPLAQLNQLQVRQQVQQLILDLLRLFWQPSSLRQLSSLAWLLLLVWHLDTTQPVCALPALQLLMMQIGRTRPILGALQVLPCSPCLTVLLIRVRGPLPQFSCLGPRA
jgi:hypothetical protein